MAIIMVYLRCKKINKIYYQQIIVFFNHIVSSVDPAINKKSPVITKPAGRRCVIYTKVSDKYSSRQAVRKM